MANRLFLSVSAVALLAAAPAWTAETSVNELIVTGTRATGGLDADRIGASVTVISMEQMMDRQVRIVSDVLRDVPGFAVSRTGAVGGLTQVRVRGTEGNHVLTLIDGIEASDPFFGEFDFATLLGDDVAKIEILRGPQSALYGSDAIAGVVNYITPSAAEAPGGRMRVEFGSQDTLSGSARYAAVIGPLDLVVNAGVHRTDGYVGQTLPGGARKLGSELQSFSAKAAYQATETLKLRGVVRYTDTHAETNASSFGVGQVDSPGSYFDARSLYWSGGADLDLLDGAWGHSLTIQGVDADRKGYARNARSSGDEGVRTKASYATTYRIETGALVHRLTGAFDWEKETYQNTSPPASGADTTRRSIKNKGLVGQYDLEIGERAGLGGAVRRDDNDFFENATTWRVQGFLKLNDAIRLRAAGGTGIKNPSQTELFGYNATGPFPFVGNPNLKPEKAKGWEAGVDLRLWDDRVSLGATYFDQTLEDEIFSASRATATALARANCPIPAVNFSTTCNRAFDSTQKGVELFGTLAFTDALSVSGSYTHLDAEENGLEEIRRAPDIGSVNVTWKPVAAATVNLTVRYNGKQLDSNFSGINPPFPASLPGVKPATGANAGKVLLPSFTLVNLSASYDLSEHFEIFARAENLTNEDYYEVFGFPTQPRAVYAGARVKF